MKFILVLLDGLSDHAYASLGNKTPLQAARTPNLDKLAVLGANGLFHASFSGQSLLRESAHYLMFGYSLASFPGSGILEAVGAGIEFDDQNIIIISNLCSIKNKSGKLILSRGKDEIKGDKKDLGMLFQTLGPYEIDRIGFEIHQTQRNEALLVLKGAVSPYISDSDPMTPGLPIAKIVPLDKNPDSRKSAITARALNRYLSHCHQLLSHLEHPSKANFLVTQRAGKRRVQTPFQHKWGLKGKLISSVSVLGGLARELGMDFLKVKESNDPGADLMRSIGLALHETRCDYIHLHTRLPGEATHKNDPEQKKSQIERLDSGLGLLVDAVARRKDILVGITAEHAISSQPIMVHSSEPAPVMFVGPTIRRDAVRHFDEVSAATGGLGIVKGPEILHIAVNYLNHGALSGNRLGPANAPFFPPPYEPFETT